MSEPYLPEPPPEQGGYWDPNPFRCPECGEIIDAHPASREDGEWEGWCQFHGTVIGTQKSEYDFINHVDEEEQS